VVISVDTGIREHEVIARGRALGVDCIVTDHHLPDDRLPAALAILNPRRPDCRYPEKELSGVGVAFKLVQALLSHRRSEPSDRLIQSYLKMVAIGTIADVVPLTGENRVIARFGLMGLSHPVHPGLTALLAEAGLNGAEGKGITAGDVGFRIAPRLNAAGRMENARDVIELFTTSEAARAREIAARLEELNRERQRVESEILQRVEESLRQHPEKARGRALVFSGEGWHRGVIGIVAQRLVDRYHRPTLVIGIENGEGQGSGRSIANFHLLRALDRVSDLFKRYGGHSQAAGFTLPADRIEELDRRFQEYCSSILSDDDLEATLRIDSEIAFDDIGDDFFEHLRRLEPWGCGNPTPVFMARGVRLPEPPRLLKEKHLKWRAVQGRQSVDAIGWGWADFTPQPPVNQPVDIVFTAEENIYQGTRNVQLILKDIRATKAANQ